MLHPEDEGTTFLRNAGKFATTRRHIPEDPFFTNTVVINSNVA
jgi:hypothetical protein